MAVVVLPYDAQQSISSFKAWLLDETGKTVAQFDKHDAKDYSANFDETVSDERMKVWMLNTMKPPYTIHYIYQREFTSNYFLPIWQPATNEKTGIEVASFNLLTENGGVNFLSSNATQTSGTADNHSWEVKNFAPVIEDDYSPALSELLPRVAVMAKEFDLYKFHGSSATWNDLGKFTNQLISERDVLETITDPPADVIIKSGGDKREVVKRLYKYLQDNFRYVSVQLGIGGWQPQAASVTMKKKFGDCKALVVVMKALLKKAGIESFYTLVNTNENRVELTTAFPHTYFNHVILCVPLENDSIWLECTSQHNPPGYLGSFTEKRNALLVYNNGATIIRTPAYTEKDNLSSSNSTIQWMEDNTVNISGTIKMEGELQESLRTSLANKEPKQIESTLLRSLKIENSKLTSFSVVELDSILPIVTLKVELNNQSIIKKTTNRLFVHSNIYNPFFFMPEKNNTRTQRVVIKKGFVKSDTLVYYLPDGYTPENFNVTDMLDLTTSFGSARSTINYNAEEHSLKVCQQFCLKEADYPAEQFSSFRDFLLKATKTYSPDLVFKKKE